MKNYPILTREQLVEKATEGKFVVDQDYECFKDMDATHARQYLELKGFKVLKNYDTGNNGWAITECGLRLSTNGYICKSPLREGE